jgi:serine/threonine-protein kinase
MPEARALPDVGRTIGDGRFELLAKLGEGGMSGVFHARDHQLDRELALKLLLPRYLGRPEREQRLINEAMYLSKLRGHANIIELYDWGRLSDHGWPWLSTELLTGESLDWLLVRGKIEAERLLDIATQVASALAACHERGVIHRDTTPGNVFVLKNGAVKLFDFSHAGALGGPRLVAGAPGRLTGVHDTPGTIGYMGPEQAAKAPADPAMDVFGFGALLFELITRRNPFAQFVDREAFIQAQREGRLEVPRLHAWAYEVPEELAAIVHECTRRTSAERPTMVAIRQRLELARTPPQTAVTSLVDVEKEASRARPRLALRAVLGTVAVVTLVALLGGGEGGGEGGGGWRALLGADSDRASQGVRPPELGSDGPVELVHIELAPQLQLEPEPEATSEPEPEAASEPEPEPEPKSVPVPEPAPDSKPAPEAPSSSGPSCDGIEMRGRLAFDQREWRTVLTQTARKSCWSTQEGTRVRLRTTALFNVGRWDECANIGALSDDPKVRSIAEACQAAGTLDQPESP